MSTKNIIIKTASFNPKIKSYVFLVVSFFMIITIIGIPLFLIWLIGLGRHVSKRYYESLKCELTTRHLEFQKGYLFRVEKMIPLENIQDITFIENPILNLFELRILKIETAGNSNPRGSDMKLMGILDSSSFKESVMDQRELLINALRSQQGSTSEKESIELLKEIRDLLKEKSK